MMQSLLVALALTTPAAGIDPPAEKITPPKGPAPAYVVARMGADGKLQLDVLVTVVIPREEERRVTTNENGKQVIRAVKVTVYVTESRVERIAADGAKVYGTDGKEIDAKKLADLLKKEQVVLVSTDGNPIDPFYLRTVKEGTLLIVGPPTRPQGVVVPAPPIDPKKIPDEGPKPAPDKEKSQ